MCQVISKALSNFHSLCSSFQREASLLAFDQLKPNQNLKSMFFPRALPQAPSWSCQASYFDLDSCQVALGFWLSFFFCLFKIFFCTSSVHAVLACPVYHSWPTLLQWLMCCHAQFLSGAMNCGSSLHPQLGDQLRLWAFPRGVGWCCTCGVMDLPQPKRGRKMRGNQRITCVHPLLYTLVHLYRLSVPENFWVFVN